MASPRHPDALRAEIYAAFAGGSSASILSREYDMSRSAILGLCRRYRVATGAPPISPDRRTIAQPKAKRVPPRRLRKLPRGPAPGGASAKPSVLAVGFRNMIPLRPGLRCDAETLSGPCGREACLDGRCLGHRYMTMRPDERLRPPPERIASEARMRAEIERMLPTRVDWRGYRCHEGVGGLTPSQVSMALSRDRNIERLAAHYGWRRIDEHTYVQRRAA